MEKFNFKLQKLLDIREDMEERSKVIFKKAQDEKNNTQIKLQNLTENYEKYSEVRKNGSVIEQKITQAYLNSLTLCIDETNEELRKKCSVLEEKREELKQKQIERKTVEILKDKQEAKFIKEQNQIEQKNNDEFALYGFIRKLERG